VFISPILGGRDGPVLYDPAMDPQLPAAFARGWRPPVAGVREALHARFREHAYPPHVHDTWTLFLVDDGAIRYDLDRRPRAAEPTMVSILPPHVVHDGRAATDAGFEMRCLYLESSLIGENAIGRAVDRPALEDGSLRAAVSALHAVLGCVDDALEAETRLAFVVERLAVALGAAEAGTPPPAGPPEADGLRAVLDAHLTRPITLAAAAATVGGSPTGLARAFATTFGVAPHAYLLGRRLDAARERIVGGAAIADVAAELGFADQAHLTRRFRQWFGTTPAALRGGPGRSAGWRGD
jgi:AraC-like DNA-binding protein